jgi:S1-C subfamily serine protease
MKQMQLTAALVLGISMSLTPSDASADEGMWLFTNPPKKWLKEHYEFAPSESWLKNLQQSAVRFNSGGSGAFVSPEGLVITNHHVGADALQKLSTINLDADGNNNGVVDAADYVVWRQSVGAMLAGAGAAALANVPEPGGLTIAVGAALGAMAFQLRRVKGRDNTAQADRNVTGITSN